MKVHLRCQCGNGERKSGHRKNEFAQWLYTEQSRKSLFPLFMRTILFAWFIQRDHMWYASLFFGLMHLIFRAILYGVCFWFFIMYRISLQFKGDVVRNAKVRMVTELKEWKEMKKGVHSRTYGSIRSFGENILWKFIEQCEESWRLK